ncbi:MAG: UDP-N-acetylmuramate--L-alanine ligase [Oscillospiraceae bacterium]|nr:UDP-N-acetylmuramate--L-alanine ligase [Oscillospiraceae bacterium]
MIGIGGSGMCPLAEILHSRGVALTGSDNNESDTLNRIRALGIPVTVGHFEDTVQTADAVVYSAAISGDNPELAGAKKRGIPCFERSLLLGALTRLFERCVGVAGTHGKTTVTSMLTQILLTGGLDPSAVIGGKLPLINANGRAGQSGLLVCEACEYHNTFLEMSPTLAVLLNIDNDHLEFFGAMENLEAAFTEFCAKAAVILVNGNDLPALKAAKIETAGRTHSFVSNANNKEEHSQLRFAKRVYTYGEGEGFDFAFSNIQKRKTGHLFDFSAQGDRPFEIEIKVPGRHNVQNAAAAAAAALLLGADAQAIQKGLREFGGAGRRFEILGEFTPGQNIGATVPETGSKASVTVADDYAHHPTELRVTLETAKSMDFKTVWAVFQPFTFSRTAMLLDEFAQALQIADKVILAEIMGSREVNTYNIYSSDLAAKIPGSVCLPDFRSIADHVTANAQPGDLVLTLGCGDIYKAAKLMLD